MEATQLPLPVLHRCDYHHSLQCKEVTPDVQNNSDQSCLLVRQENTQTVFKPPRPVTALSYRVMHATGLQETVPIRKHNSIQQKVAKLSLDWSRRFNFKLTILLSSEAGSTGIIWFPAAPLQMMAISIPISGWWFISPMSFSRSSLTVRKVLTRLGCTEQMVPDQRLVLELGVSGLPKPSSGGCPLQPPWGQQFADRYRWVTRSAMLLDVSRSPCSTASAQLIYNLYPWDFTAWCYNITSALGSLGIAFCRKWRAHRGAGREWLKPTPSCLCPITSNSHFSNLRPAWQQPPLFKVYFYSPLPKKRENKREWKD